MGTPASANISFMKVLEPSSNAPSAPGPITGTPIGSESVGEAVDQRRLGADDDQVGVDLFDRCVGGRDRLGHTGIARGDHDVSGSRQHMGERVLAAPAADDADPHAVAKETNCSRPGPTPTRRTGTPICSDKNAT